MRKALRKVKDLLTAVTLGSLIIVLIVLFAAADAFSEER